MPKGLGVEAEIGHPGIYEFAGFRLDPAEHLLRMVETDEIISVSPRAFDALVYFVERRGQLIDKTALMKALWPSTVVEENSLTQTISTLRRALGEKPGEQRFIATVAGRGYRFVAPVSAVAAAAAPAYRDRSIAGFARRGRARGDEPSSHDDALNRLVYAIGCPGSSL